MSHLMDSDQLKAFIAIADTGSFTRAAELVSKTQSAVSMQMKKLEERVGRPIFDRDGRGARLTADGEKLLDYARRIVRLNQEALATFNEAALAGHVRLGLPDDYADRYLPEILMRFSASHPRVEVSVLCEPSRDLLDRLQANDLDLAIITHTESKGPARIIRRERLLWVSSQRHTTHELTPLPLALGRPNCTWRQVAESALASVGRPHRVLYTSWNSTAVTAAVLAGLAISVLPESGIRQGMRILRPSDGFPELPSCKIALARSRRESTALVDALEGHIVSSLDNLSGDDFLDDEKAVAAE